MLRKYELTVIYNQDDKVRAEGVDFLEKVLAARGAKINTRNEIGNRVLAYEIDKMSRGYYIYYELEAEESAIALITRELNLSHLILRFLFVQVEDETPGQEKRRLLKEQKIKKFLAKKAEYANKQKEKTPDKDKQAELDESSKSGDASNTIEGATV